MTWTKRWTKRLRALVHKEAVERELDEELAFHLEMETKKNLQAGMSPDEARRRAVLRFGGVEGFKEEVRDARGLAWLTGMLLDFRLGGRMLVKYPGLTVVGTLAIAFAICVGVGTFEFISQAIFPTLAFEDGDRVVGVRSWDAVSSEMKPSGLHDFVGWREELRSVEELGAYRTVDRNLITGDGRGVPVEVAEISASGLQVTRVPALLGRTLVAADAEEDAPPVIVLGHELWQRRFAADSGVVGRVVRLGRQQATVVGVMPEGFGFPVSHNLWMPLRLDALRYPRGEEPRVEVFGRLAPGASLREAQTELAALGERTAADFAETHRHLRPRVMPYPRTVVDPGPWLSLGILSTNGFIVVLLVLVCGNVALLMFARAATREAEIAVRSALGASRRRIVAQMFAEALVLAAVGGALGLAAAGYLLQWGMHVLEADILDGQRLPFWFHGTLSPASVIYAVLLTLLAAGIAGVIPALKMTREGLEGRLREIGAGGGGPRFGGVWTAVIVAQVAVTVIFPILTHEIQREMREVKSYQDGFAAEHFLSTRLLMERETWTASGDTSRDAMLSHQRAIREELERRLLENPAVEGVTFASNVPRARHGRYWIETEGGDVVPLDTVRQHLMARASISPDYFEVLGTQVLSGRGFHAGDVETGARVVIANSSFVEQVLGGRNAVGRRVRYLATAGEGDPALDAEPWYEIVGVAPDLGMNTGTPSGAGLYHPLTSDAVSSPFLLARVRGKPEAFGPTLQRLAASVDPTLQLHQIRPLDEMDAAELEFLDFSRWLTGLLTGLALILSWAAIYAVTSFTVSRRTREIGIRVAMGGRAHRVVLSVLRRPLAQVTLGITLAMAVFLPLWIGMADPGKEPSAQDIAILLGYAAVMVGVCLLACIIPARRALGVEPTEALRTE
jgi:putative ABC transport system permease protein